MSFPLGAEPEPVASCGITRADMQLEVTQLGIVLFGTNQRFGAQGVARW